MTKELTAAPLFLQGGGEMGALIRDYHWGQTSLGSPEAWPQSLRTTLSILLNSRFPMFLFWGPESVCFYNDAYRPSLGKQGEGKHPCIGKPGAEVWPEIWHIIGPQIEQVRGGGEATWFEDQLVPIYRNGKIEDVYWTYSYSPVRDESGLPAGVFVTCTETTDKILSLEQAHKNERELNERNERLHAALSASQTGTFRWNIQTNELSWDENLDRLFGLPPGQTVRSLEKFIECVYPDDRQGVIDDCRRCAEEGADFDRVFRVIWPDGSVHWLDDKGKTFRDRKGSPLYMTGACTDITEPRKAVEALRESEGRFRRLIQSNIVGVLFWNLDGGITDANEAFLEMLGYTRSDLEKGLDWRAITPPQWAEADRKGVEEIIATGRHSVFEKQYLHKNGTPVDVLLGGSAFEGTANREGVTFVLNISERKKAERALAESEEQFRTLANSIPQLAWMTDAEGWIYWYNQRWYDYTGTTLEEMQGWGWQKVHHPDLIDGVVARFKKAIAAGSFWEDTFLLRSKNGDFRWFLSRAYPIKNADGILQGWFGTNTDVTEERKVQDKLRESEERFRSIANDAPVFIFMGDANADVSFVNQSWIRFTGLTAEQAVGQGWATVTHPDDLQRSYDIYGNAVKTQTSYQYEMQQKGGDGEWHWVQWRGIPRFLPDGEFLGILGIGIDITGLKNAETKLKQSEERFRQLADLVPQALWTARDDGYIDYYNKRWYEYTGMNPGDYGDEGWSKVVHPDDLQHLMGDYYRSIQTGEPHNSEFRLRERSTGNYRWFVGRAMPVRNAEGKIIKWFGSCTDIHDQKTLSDQLEKLVADRTRELQRSNEDLMQFAHVASHDLKEPVRKIMTFESRLRHEAGETLSQSTHFYLDKIQKAAGRMYAMIEGVLHYSSLNGREVEREDVNLNAVLDQVVLDLELVIAQKNAVVRYANLPVVKGSRVLLQQLFYNLLNNSLKFTKAGVPPLVQLRSEVLETKEEGRRVRITVADNGIGFDPAYAEQIFSTFTRLNSKDKFEGTGLGLALCKKIVERHGGSITANGKPDEGASFVVELPV